MNTLTTNSMINPENTKELAESLTEHLDRFVLESRLKELSPKQRAYLASLCYQDSIGNPNAIGIMKDILGIKAREVDKKEGYLINKGLI